MILLQLFVEFAKVGLFTVGGGMASVPFLVAMSDKTGWFTQAQLAELLETSPSYIGAIESTKMHKPISLKTLFRLADALDVHPSKLLED